MLLICLSDASLKIDATTEFAFDAFHCLWICLLPPIAAGVCAIGIAFGFAIGGSFGCTWWLVAGCAVGSSPAASQPCPASSRRPCSNLLSIGTSRMHPGPAAIPSMVSCTYCTSFLNFLAPCGLSKARAPSHPHCHYHTHTHPALLARCGFDCFHH